RSFLDSAKEQIGHESLASILPLFFSRLLEDTLLKGFVKKLVDGDYHQLLDQIAGLLGVEKVTEPLERAMKVLDYSPPRDKPLRLALVQLLSWYYDCDSHELFPHPALIAKKVLSWTPDSLKQTFPSTLVKPTVAYKWEEFARDL